MNAESHLIRAGRSLTRPPATRSSPPGAVIFTIIAAVIFSFMKKKYPADSRVRDPADSFHPAHLEVSVRNVWIGFMIGAAPARQVAHSLTESACDAGEKIAGQARKS